MRSLILNGESIEEFFFAVFGGAGARLGGGILIGWYFKERCKGGEW